MAAPGIGAGDIVDACKFIYGICRKYKDAREEFDEVAEKAKSTTVVLTRLDNEAKMGGSLLERAGPEAYDQLQENLKSLRSDSQKLGKLIAKYAKIHDEGPGRRLLWALKESGNLTDMRRQISYHEQTLQFWYMTLVYGSLRRLESGQEEIIEAIKGMRQDQLREIMSALDRGDPKPLKRELKKKGISKEDIDVNLVTACHYVEASPIEKVRIESLARSRSSTMRPSPYTNDLNSDLRPGRFPSRPNDDESYDSSLSHTGEQMRFSRKHRSISHTRPTTRHADDWSDDDKSGNFLVVRSRSRPGPLYRSKSPKEPILTVPYESSSRPRRKSDIPRAPPASPLLIVRDQDPAYLSDPKRRRSTRRSSDAGEKEDSNASSIMIVGSQRHRSKSRGSEGKRDSSTHSYQRERPSSSRGKDRDDRVETSRQVTKMDRIDSMPVDESGGSNVPYR